MRHRSTEWGYRILDCRAESVSFDLTPTLELAEWENPNENCWKVGRIPGSLPEVPEQLTYLEWGKFENLRGKGPGYIKGPEHCQLIIFLLESILTGCRFC